MSPKTKDRGWFLDDSSAVIGFNPLREIKSLTEQEEKKLTLIKTLLAGLVIL